MSEVLNTASVLKEPLFSKALLPAVPALLLTVLSGRESHSLSGSNHNGMRSLSLGGFKA
jgi:hypothetical protein